VEGETSNADFARVMGHFDFGRKAGEALESSCAGESGGGPRLDALAWCTAFAYRPESRSGAGTEKSFLGAERRALELATWAMGNPAALACLGVNSWEGVEYYSKELFEEAVDFSILLAGTERLIRRGESAGESDRELASVLLAAEKASGFRTSRLLLALESMAAASENSFQGIVG
jgi:hypothetical protein